MYKYWRNILVAIDQLINTLAGGDPDETISSRCGKKVADSRLCRFVCLVLHRFDNNHCAMNIEKDEGENGV
jgi:hypothetical protein